MGFWFFKIEFGWILGRQDIRNTELYNEVLERAINDFGFKTKGTIEPPQVDCTYDFVNEYWEFNQTKIRHLPINSCRIL